MDDSFLSGTVQEMKPPVGDNETDNALRELYPSLGHAELQEAQENLNRYLELALRVYERIQADPQAYAQFKALTASPERPTIKNKRSN